MIFLTCHIKIKQKFSDYMCFLEKGSLLCSHSAMRSLIYTVYYDQRTYFLFFHSDITDKKEDNKSLTKERKTAPLEVCTQHIEERSYIYFPLGKDVVQQMTTAAYMTPYHATA